ncbi:hypothetical protein [Lentzea sp. NBRC 102530]|uniref:hypothetical protein n=1 Tax=Lentzea sp. NBRC 102530 TaxID=3032201 RepID=UPI0024A3B7EE|nr:hypothetical protein [Lentzea sp. NBRC 102530]GLY51762.1 hypothetical protein Lesp01_54180 [Lentzea sp. NBRC 102530]
MTLTSCGIRPTPVLTGGDGPTVSSHTLTIYLVKPEGDGLVRRTRSYTGKVDITTSMNLLLAGPDEEEKKLGLLSEVPVTDEKAQIVLGRIALPPGVQPTSKWAILQIECTALAARARVEGVEFTDENCP